MIKNFRLDNSKTLARKEAVARSLEIANNYAGELSIEVVSLDKIELDPENKREMVLTLEDAMHGIKKSDPEYEAKKRDYESLESLAKTIRDNQLINPIFVYRYGNKCRLIAGERRTLASAIAGKKEIIARISPERPERLKVRILQWVENDERSDLSLPEKLETLELILKEYVAETKRKGQKEQITARLLHSLTGISARQANRYITILRCEQPTIRKAIDEKKLTNLKLIEFICKTKDTGLRELLLNKALLGASLDKLKRIVKASERVETRGRKKKQRVDLGKVKLNTAQFVLDALLAAMNDAQIKQLGISKIDRDGCKSLQTVFEKLIPILEADEITTNE